MPHPPLITLSTDFGTKDPYVAALKGVFYSSLPDVRIVDVTHQLPAFQPELALPFLLDSLPWFPPRSYHLVVVDPGVGSKRKGLLLHASFGWAIMPDNGLPALIHRWLGPVKYFSLHRDAFPGGNDSPTFQARDFFAPALLRLIKGERPETFAVPISLDELEQPSSPREGEFRIWNIDRFGNILLGFRVTLPPVDVITAFRNQSIPYVKRYQDVCTGKLGVLVNSSGWIEIFCREGSAASTMDCKVGQTIPVRIIGGEGQFL